MKEYWKSQSIRAAAIVVLTVLVYLPAMQGGFIWDDDDHLTENPAMTASDGLRQIWSSLRVSRYYPLTLTNFWVQRRLWGLHPLPYHAVNVLFHGASAALVFILLSRLRVPGAWAAAAFWALHPVCVESVAWVTETKNTQSGLLFFLAVLCYLRFEERPGYRWYALTLLCGVAAMVSKPSTVVLPAVLLLLVWWQRGRCRWRDCWRVAPLFAFAGAMSALTIIEQRGQIERHWREVVLSGWERGLLMGKVVWFYLGKVFWPVDLMFIYPQWQLRPASLFGWLPLIAAVVVGSILWMLRRRPWARGCLLGLGFFVLLLLPVSGLVNIYFFCYSFVGDHFQYLACLGPLALATAGGTVLVRRERLRTVGTVFVLVVFGVQSWRYSHVFQSQDTLWRDTLAKNPRAWMAHNNLGLELFGAGDIEGAMAEYRTSLGIKSNNVEAYNNLGFALASQGKLAEAAAEYRAALRIDPNSVAVHDNFGNTLARQGRFAEAVAEYRAALRIKPDYAQAYYNMANTLANQGSISEAIVAYRAALHITPNIIEIRNNLGSILARQGSFAEATTEFQAALRIHPNLLAVRDNLGNVLADQGRIAEAIAVYRETLRLKPDWQPALSKLAWILATDQSANLRSGAEAVPLAERLCMLTGYEQADALMVLAAAYAEAGRFTDAARFAQRALELARANGQRELTARIEEQLKLYQAGRPYHEDSIPGRSRNG